MSIVIKDGPLFRTEETSTKPGESGYSEYYITVNDVNEIRFLNYPGSDAGLPVGTRYKVTRVDQKKDELWLVVVHDEFIETDPIVIPLQQNERYLNDFTPAIDAFLHNERKKNSRMKSGPSVSKERKEVQLTSHDLELIRHAIAGNHLSGTFVRINGQMMSWRITAEILEENQGERKTD